MADNYSRDPDDLHGDTIVAYLKISVRRNGSMSTEGCIDQEAYALAMLDNARDAIKNHNARKKLNDGKRLITPHYDTPLAP